MARLFLRSGLAENSVYRGGFGLYPAGVLVYLQPLNSSWTVSRMARNSGLMQGKRGVILGVANNRSLAMKRPAPDISLGKD